jgi:DNA-directed RNA polymerase subunit beta'
LKTLFKYYILLDGLNIAIKKSLNKFKLIFINSIQAIYQSQGVYISNKHLEIIVKNMTSKAIIKNRGNTYFLPGELIKISFLNQIFDIYSINNKLYEMAIYEPKFLSIKSFSINSESFIANASFQETKKVLTKAAIEGSKDWISGLKESIIIGKSIPAGSTFINYKNYLDNIFKFKD